MQVRDGLRCPAACFRIQTAPVSTDRISPPVISISNLEDLFCSTYPDPSSSDLNSLRSLLHPLSTKPMSFIVDLLNHLQFSSVTQSCPTLCNPMNRSMPGLPVHHQLLKFTQTHVHRVSDAIQPSHPLSSPSPPAPSPSQHQGLFQ